MDPSNPAQDINAIESILAGVDETPLYPPLRALGGSSTVETRLCQHPQYPSGVVQKLFAAATLRPLPELETYGKRLTELWHPALLSPLETGWERDRFFYIRPFSEAPNWLEATQKLPAERLLTLIGQLLEGLAALQAQQLTHLRLKPENIFVESDQVKISDFGLDPLLRLAPLEGAGLWGLPHYSAPEYAQSGKADPRADLYTVGVLAYQALAGRLPFSASSSQELLQKQLQQRPSSLTSARPDLPVPVAAWLEGLLSPDPAQRGAGPEAALRELLRRVPVLPVPLLPLIREPELVLRESTLMTFFRRLLLQGGQWALTAPAGAGKSFVARWLRQYFQLNQRPVLLLRGADLPLQEEFPTDYVWLIDDADRAPVEAIFSLQRLSHVVVLGEQLSWAQAPRWQRMALPELKPGDWEKALATLPAELHSNGFKNPGDWQQRIPVLLKNAAAPSAAAFALPALSRAPWSLSELAAATGQEEGRLQSQVSEWARQAWLERRWLWGEAYFLSTWTSSEALKSQVPTESILNSVPLWIEQGRPELAVSLLEFYFGKTPSPPLARLLMAEAQAARFQSASVLELLSADFVKGMPEPELRGRAFRALALALLQTQKAKPAESAFKNAFTALKEARSISYQAQLLGDLAQWERERSQISRALKFLGQALDLQAQLSPALQAQLQARLAQVYLSAQDFSAAERHLLQATELYFSAGAPAALGALYLTQSELELQKGQWELARHFAREAARAFLFFGQERPAGVAFLRLARAEAKLENQLLLLRRFHSAEFYLRNFPHDKNYGELILRRAYFYEVNRQLDNAQADAERALQLAKQAKSYAWLGRALLIQGKIKARDMAQQAAAVQLLTQARQYLEQAQVGEFLWEAPYELAELKALQNAQPEAQELYRQALVALETYLRELSAAARQLFLHDGKRERIQQALRRWS